MISTYYSMISSAKAEQIATVYQTAPQYVGIYSICYFSFDSETSSDGLVVQLLTCITWVMGSTPIWTVSPYVVEFIQLRVINR